MKDNLLVIDYNPKKDWDFLKALRTITDEVRNYIVDGEDGIIINKNGEALHNALDTLNNIINTCLNVQGSTILKNLAYIKKV